MLKNYQAKLNKNSEVYLRIKVRPGAQKNEVKQVLADETLKINIAAKPVNNQANAQLLKFLSKQFFVPAENIKIISGKSESLKLIKIKK